MRALLKAGLFVWLFLSAFQLLAQNINYAEYFINTDPGLGNATAISFTPDEDVSLDFNADLSALDNGFHMLYIRAHNDSGWSHVYTHPFTIFAVNAGKPNISYLEYFIDSDPGIGSGTEVSIETPGFEQDISFTADLSALDNGFHTIYVRARDANGNWCHVYSRAFTIFAATAGKPDITYLEYFIDTDPGIGSGTSVPVTPDIEQDISFTADLGGLDNGFHTIYVRARDANGNWCHVYSKQFTIFAATAGKPDITYLEYFIDTDPGIGSGTSVPITAPGIEQDISFTADLSGLDNGFHTIYVRARDANGNWCHVYSRQFTIFSSAGLSNIVQLEYFVDNDPGYGLANQVTLNETAKDIEQDFVVDVSGYSYGHTHTLYVRGKDENGNWTMVYWGDFVKNEVSATAMPPEGGTVTGEETEDADGVATLEATPNTGYDFINWTEVYSGTEVSTNLIYEPTITGDTSFYANFQIQTFNIDVSTDPVATGTASGTGTYDYGTTIYLEAEPAEHYKFINWTKGGSQISTDNPFELDVVNDCTIVANFELLENFEITAEVSPVDAGNVSGTETYDINTTATLTAEPATHYKFVNWTINSVEVETSSSYSFTVTQDCTVVANFELLENFEVSASANPAGGGSTTVNGTLDIGTTATVEAFANTGYEFTNWVINDDTVSTSFSYSFTVSQDCTLVANFTALPSYNVQVSANPSEGGSYDGDDSYYEGTTATVHAYPNAGYYFVNWTEDGSELSTNSTYNFTVTNDTILVANFALYDYTVAATADPSAGGSVSGSGNFNYNDVAELVATPAQYYKFINWTSGGTEVSTLTDFDVTVQSDCTLVANFEAYDYVIEASSSPGVGGTVSGGGGYDDGESVNLTATPAIHYDFVNWTSNGTEMASTATLNFTATQDCVVVANFALETFDIAGNSSPPEGGEISGSDTYNYGETATLTATTNNHYTFTNWTVGNDTVSTNESYNISVSQDCTVVANFVIEEYAITTTALPITAGTVGGAGSFTYGTNVTLVPSPYEGYEFVNWTENEIEVSTDNPYSFTSEADRSLTAHFQLITVRIANPIAPAGSGSVSGAGDYTYGETINLDATPATGYSFVNWTESDTVVSTNSQLSFTAHHDRTITANFEHVPVNITATVSSESGGSVAGGGTYTYGDEVELVATLNEGYHFMGWIESDTVFSDTTSISFIASHDRTLMASFDINTYNVQAEANPETAGTISGIGTYNHGETVNLTATSSAEYNFISWTESDTVVSNSSQLSFTVKKDRLFSANFELRQIVIQASASPDNSGTITGAGTYTYGDSVKLSAVAAGNFTFINWTESDTIVSNNVQFAFLAESDRSFTANFGLSEVLIQATVSPDNSGNVSGAGTYSYGDSVKLIAEPVDDYFFVCWMESDTVVSDNSQLAFIAEANRSFTANFGLSEAIIQATVSPNNSGSVTGTGTYNYGDSVKLVAQAADHYSFLNWTERDTMVSDNPQFAFIAQYNRTFIANFDLDGVEIKASVNPTEGGTVSGTGIYTIGDNVSLHISPIEGYRFINWTENDTVVSEENEILFTASHNRIFTANLEKITISIEVFVNPENAGSITGAGNYNFGESIMLSATPNENYEFENWTENESVVSTDAQYSFNAEKSRKLSANFSSINTIEESDGYYIAVYPNPFENIMRIESNTIINTIKIFDYAGKLIINKKDMNTFYYSIDLKNEKAGIYFVKVGTPYQSTITKIIKE